MRKARIMRWFLALLASVFAAPAVAANPTHPGTFSPDKPVLYHGHGLSFYITDGGSNRRQIAKEGELP